MAVAGGPRLGAGDHRRDCGYDGTGSFEEAAERIGPEIGHLLTSLAPEDQQDLVALAGIAGLLQRYSGNLQVENALIEEVGGTGLPDMSFAGTYAATTWDEVETLVAFGRSLRVRDGQGYGLRAPHRLPPVGHEAVALPLMP